MPEGFTLGRYEPGEGFLHRLDGRVKVAGTFILTVGSFWATNWLSLGVLLLFLFGVWGLGGLPFGLLDRNLRPVWWLIVFTVLLHLFGDPGPSLSLGPVGISLNGLTTGGLLALRLVFLVELSALLTATTTPLEITAALEDLLSPLARIGVPVWDLALMVAVALRFVPVFWDEAAKIRRAQLSRGADLETGNPFRLFASLLPLLVPLFASAFRRAEELALAMEARLYRPAFRRTRLQESRWGIPEYLAGFAVLFLVALVLRLGGGAA